MKSPTNTAKLYSENPMLAVVDVMANGQSIERQEKQGQQELVNSDVIPSTHNMNSQGEGDQKLIAMGFILGEPVPSDPLFRYATLPQGWHVVCTDHNMWSKIVDKTGKERCSIFYKAVFYDRKAFINICKDEPTK